MLKGLESFETLVEALQNLPAIGKKSARNIAYHMVAKDTFGALKIAHAIEKSISSIQKCKDCGNLSENELCEICINENRDSQKLCIVSNGKDILVIEESGHYNGKYFIFDSIDEKNIEKLMNIIEKGTKEVIFAFSPSIQSDALIYFIEERIKIYGIDFSKIAQGVPTGVSLENIDVVSLSRAFESRIKI